MSGIFEVRRYRISRGRLAGFMGILALALSPLLTAQPEADANTSVEVPTEKLLPAELLQREAYKLTRNTTIYQGVALYEMHSEFGQSTLVGRQGLLQRIDELQAIDQLRAMKGTEVYKKALKKSAKAPVETVKNLASSPVETIKNVGRGLGGFLSDVGYSMVSDDPNQENAAKTAIGFAAAKRALAYTLGVSPYSSFQPLQDELSEVAWTSVSGGLTVSMGFSEIGGATGTLVKTTGTAESMRGMVRDNSPRKLQNINYDKLIAMGIKESLAEAMLDNFNYNPEEEVRLIGALASMEGVEGREKFIERAALQDQSYNARLMREWAELFANYHANVQKVKAIVIAQTAPLMVLKDGTVLALFPADYITLDPTFEARYRVFTKALRAQGLEPGEVWITGRVDPELLPLLADIGWEKVAGNADKLVQPPAP